MKIESTEFKGLFIIEPRVFEDERGYFFESFNKRAFEAGTGLSIDFVQDNESMSNKGALRGLHFQRPPHAQGKLVRVTRGAVRDVCVDLREEEPTFGKHISLELSESNKKSLYIPEGFAHGFVTLEDKTVFQYKCTEFYHRDSECTLLWNDTDLSIDWNIESPTLSKKDREGKTLLELSEEHIFSKAKEQL